MLRTRARSWKDTGATLLVWSAPLLVSATFVWISYDIVGNGLSRISWDFLLSAPSDAGRQGGIGTILVSTGLILFVCMAVCVPLGLPTAILLAESGDDRRLYGRLTRRSLDVLAGVPSIVFGLFGNAFFCHLLGLGFSILSGGLTLACMVLPIFIRTSEAGLRSVPNDYRRAAAALGMSRTSTVLRLLLPVAAPGLLAGLILGIGRAVAETAALIFTSGYVDRMPSSLFDSGRSLSIHIYDLSMNVAGGNETAYASALVLGGALIVINSSTAWLAGPILAGRIFQR